MSLDPIALPPPLWLGGGGGGDDDIGDGEKGNKKTPSLSWKRLGGRVNLRKYSRKSANLGAEEDDVRSIGANPSRPETPGC